MIQEYTSDTQWIRLRSNIHRVCMEYRLEMHVLNMSQLHTKNTCYIHRRGTFQDYKQGNPREYVQSFQTGMVHKQWMRWKLSENRSYTLCTHFQTFGSNSQGTVDTCAGIN